MVATIISIVTGVITILLSIIAFFFKRELDNKDKDIREIKEDQKEQRKRDEDKREDLRKEYEEKLSDFHDKIGSRIDGFATDHARGREASSHDIHEGDSRLRKEFEELRRELQADLKRVEREFLEFKGFASSHYVNRQDFIRECTLLESRVVATKRTLDGLDGILKEYLGG